MKNVVVIEMTIVNVDMILENPLVDTDMIAENGPADIEMKMTQEEKEEVLHPIR